MKKITILGIATVMFLTSTTGAEALSKKDFMSQAKYYGVNVDDNTSFDAKALEGISLPYTRTKLYIEHNEQFTKPILDGLVEAVSEAIGEDLYNTQYEMEGLVETYKDYYKASHDSSKIHTRHFGYAKLGTDEMRVLAKPANTDFIVYADVVPLFGLKKASKTEFDDNGLYDYDDVQYYQGGKYKVSKTNVWGNGKKIELNLRLRVFNTKKNLFTYVSTQRLIGKSHNTGDERAVRHAVWRFVAHENNPKTDDFFKHRSDKLHIVLE